MGSPQQNLMTRLCGSCCLPTGLVARLYVTLPHISLAHPTRIWPFELPHKRQHAQLGIRTRKERPFPDALTGLGWCTWDSLGRDVNEQAIVNKMEEFQAKHVPISWVLIDDGWSNTDPHKGNPDRLWRGSPTFPPRACPHHCAAQNALWRAQRRRVAGVQGYWNGLDESGVAAASCPTAITTTANGCLIPGSRAEQPAQFWDAWDGELAEAGVDFVKVDSQSSTSVMVRGTESYGEATWGRHQALDEVTSRRFGGALINCMGMAPEDYWHRPSSPITRSSDDYLPHNPDSLGEHLIQNAYCALLMGELYHCDWDMFWTEHPHARVHAVLRLLSGGPVYCSDACGHTDAAVLRVYLPKMVHYRVLMSRPDQSLRHCSMTPNIRTMRSVSQQDSAQNRSSLSSDCAGSHKSALLRLAVALAASSMTMVRRLI